MAAVDGEKPLRHLPGDGKTWRAMLEEVGSHECHHFANLTERKCRVRLAYESSLYQEG